MAKSKQPYMPLYLGDYIQDTRVLPLSVRGAWVDLLLNMWKSPHRGVLVESLEEYARMLSCTLEECNFAVSLLMQKNVCDFEKMKDGKIKLVSRRMVRDTYLSLTRSESGKNGVEAKKNKKFASGFAEAKIKQNTDIDNDIDNETVLKGVQGENIIYTIEHCGEVALKDARWTKANNTNIFELQEFNLALEQQGIYEKNPMQYKSHFAHWKRKGKLTIVKNDTDKRNNEKHAGSAGEARVNYLKNGLQ